MVVFLASRAVLVWAGTDPDAYAPGGAPFAADADVVFAGYASKIVQEDRAPYSGFFLEYPPGSIPFIVIPELLRPADVGYRTALVAFMFLVDAAGLAGAMRLSSRCGSALGPWLWVLLVPLTGPIAYVRIDLVPAVATIWAVERSVAGGWFAAGAALGFGAAIKGYPLVLLLLLVAVAPRRLAVAAGGATLLLAPLLPLIGALPEMVSQVVQYHTGRDVHIESTFGSVLLLLNKLGYETPIVAAHATLQFSGSASSALALTSTVSVVGVVFLGAWLAGARRGQLSHVPATMFATLAVALALANVFSPQYMFWVIAIGVAATSVANPVARRPVALLIPAAALTQVVYPFYYQGLLRLDIPALLALFTRNALVATAGVWAFVALRKSRLAAASEPGA